MESTKTTHQQDVERVSKKIEQGIEDVSGAEIAKGTRDAIDSGVSEMEVAQSLGRDPEDLANEALEVIDSEDDPEDKGA